MVSGEASAFVKPSPELPVAILGAGPVGLAAAARCLQAGVPFQIFESRVTAAGAVREWAHVRLFSPWADNVDPVAASLLVQGGWTPPDGQAIPTGHALVTAYLNPLAALPPIAAATRLGTRVTSITREGPHRSGEQSHDSRPLLVHVDGGKPVRVAVVIDATGTWDNPASVLTDGRLLIGEAVGAQVHRALPTPEETARLARRSVIVVGSGHSAMGSLLGLAAAGCGTLGTGLSWVVRGTQPDLTGGVGTAAIRSARRDQEQRLQLLIDTAVVRVISGFHTTAVCADGNKVRLTAIDGRSIVADDVVAATGFEPDHSIARELQIDLDPTYECPRLLAPVIDPQIHTCGSVPIHGMAELAHPEGGYFIVGMKSYGRAPTFLLATGYQQLEAVISFIVEPAGAPLCPQLQP